MLLDDGPYPSARDALSLEIISGRDRLTLLAETAEAVRAAAAHHCRRQRLPPAAVAAAAATAAVAAAAAA